MQPRGFEEQQVEYSADPAAVSPGQFRRFSEVGPAYEVMRVVDPDQAWIRVVYTGEELAYPVADVRLDPIAETIP